MLVIRETGYNESRMGGPWHSYYQIHTVLLYYNTLVCSAAMSASGKNASHLHSTLANWFYTCFGCIWLYSWQFLLLLPARKQLSHWAKLAREKTRTLQKKIQQRLSGYCSATLFFFCIPRYISGIHHFSVGFLCIWTFFNPAIEVVTFCLHGWCMLGVFLLLAFTCPGHECQDLLSPCNGMHVCTD